MKELAENYDDPVLKWRAKCECASAKPKSAIPASANADTEGSSDEVSESEVLICTQSQSESLRSTPQGDVTLLSTLHGDVTLPHGDMTHVSPRSGLDSHSHQAAEGSAVTTPPLTSLAPNYILVGDNWDKNVRPRHMTMEHQTSSLHLFHAYAVLDRVDCTSLPDTAPTANLEELSPLSFLPSVEDCTQLRDDYITLVARTVVEKLPAFKPFASCVEKHIPHQYTSQMKEESVVVRHSFILSYSLPA